MCKSLEMMERLKLVSGRCVVWMILMIFDPGSWYLEAAAAALFYPCSTNYRVARFWFDFLRSCCLSSAVSSLSFCSALYFRNYFRSVRNFFLFFFCSLDSPRCLSTCSNIFLSPWSLSGEILGFTRRYWRNLISELLLGKLTSFASLLWCFELLLLCCSGWCMSGLFELLSCASYCSWPTPKPFSSICKQTNYCSFIWPL